MRPEVIVYQIPARGEWRYHSRGAIRRISPFSRIRFPISSVRLALSGPRTYDDELYRIRISARASTPTHPSA